jgi:carbonic anhydrase/acetyltransferase-like protein (isoleucine patch superfamily)
MRLRTVGRSGEMIIRHRNQDPAVDTSSFLPLPVLIGAVNVGPRSRVMYGAVLDSEGSRVEVGDCTVVCKNAVLRASKTGNAR